MPSIPSSFIDEVRAATDIVALISHYVPLKPAGKSFKGICPFHHEKTPSFNVSPDRQIFHCFGCGQGGDAFKFLMLYDKLSFIEALAQLAARAGLRMPTSLRGAEGAAGRDERSLWIELHEEACRFFQRQLLEAPGGRKARAYLKDRGLTDQTIVDLGLGWAAESWSDLLEYLTRRGAKPEELGRSGLAIPRRSGRGFYDRFRGRVMIPIRNESGKVVAFGGRLLGGGEPKYLNSPESPIYNKGRLLYGFDRAKDAIRQEGSAILMEGYLDSIQAHQAGIANTVACCGTSLTTGHARLLRRYADRILVSFDPDAAGEAATRRGIDLLLEEGFQVLVVELPSNEDPDSYIRRQGAEAYRRRIASAPSFVDYLIDRAARRYDVGTPRGKADFLNAVLPTLARIPNHVERVAYVSRLSERADIADAAVVEELRRQVMARTHQVSLPPEARRSLRPAERDLVRWLLQTPEEARVLLAEIEEEDFEALVTASILRAMKELLSSGDLSLERILDRLSADADRNLLTRIVLEPSPLGPRQSPRDCLNRLREQRWRQKISRLRTRLGQGSNDDEIAAEIQSLARRIETLGRIETLA